MIEPTDEIQRAYAEAWYTEIGLEEDEVQQVVAVELRDPMRWRIEALKAVLAIIERDHVIEVSKLRGALKLAGDSRELWKQRATDAGWPKEEPARWRCNRTERCVREDGHDGHHAFTGAQS